MDPSTGLQCIPFCSYFLILWLGPPPQANAEREMAAKVADHSLSLSVFQVPLDYFVNMIVTMDINW